MKNDSATEYSRIYDYFYKKFADRVKYKITNGSKVKIIDQIFKDISWDFQTAIRAGVKYNGFSTWTKTKITKIEAKQLAKTFDTAMKHMYSPNNIRLAVPKYYNIRSKKKTPLTKEDFGHKTYVLTALQRSGIIYREQLLKHLDIGWYYLWTIPGCGDVARQIILRAIDKWNGKD